jgi:hypothetical protein
MRIQARLRRRYQGPVKCPWGAWETEVLKFRDAERAVHVPWSVSIRFGMRV